MLFAIRATAEEVLIEGTSLRITLPQGWQLASSKVGEPVRNVLRHQGDPASEVQVSQFSKWPESARLPMSLPFECDTILGSFAASGKTPSGRTASLGIRPDYFPDEFYSRVLISELPDRTGSESITGCLFLGDSSVEVDLQPPTLLAKSGVQEILQAIVKAGKQQSTLLYAPGNLLLPVLNVTASFSSGAWGIGKEKWPNSSDFDLLVRTGGAVESKFTPFLVQGVCNAGMDQSYWKPFTGQAFPANPRKNAPYVGSKWHPDAFETVLPPSTKNSLVNSRLLVITCRQMDTATELLVLIWYGSDKVSDKEAPMIAKLLDEIADAVLRGPKGDGVLYIPPTKLASAPITPTEVGGGGQNTTVTAVLSDGSRLVVPGHVQAGHLVNRIQPAYPALARQMRIEGTVKLHAIIDKDGTVLQLAVISGHPLLIQSAIDAVKQWRYEPTVFEGRPVQVDSEIDVVFALSKNTEN
jgi:TonB family protein